MKIVILFSILFASFHTQAKVVALDTALETGGIQVEYMDSSQRGTVRVKNCEQCQQSIYHFTDIPEVIRQGKVIPFKAFMQDYWNASYPTLIINNESLHVIKVIY